MMLIGASQKKLNPGSLGIKNLSQPCNPFTYLSCGSLRKCKDCNTTIKKKNKTKHEQPKKYKYFSNLLLNKYVIKDIAVDKFKVVVTQYCNEHIKNSILPQFVFIGDLMIQLIIKYQYRKQFHML